MVVDFATPAYSVAFGGDFEAYVPVTDGAQLATLRAVDSNCSLNG
jgi:hypothetical protein